MILIEYATIADSALKAGLGAPEYSYAFVRKGFRRLLDQLGTRVEISNPEKEVDAIYAQARAAGEECVFLSYTAPQSTTLGLECPTIPIFAWEFDTLPDEVWGDEIRNDWRNVLSRSPLAITHCQFAVDVTRRSMGADYPIWSIPTPLYNVFVGSRSAPQPFHAPFERTFEGGLVVQARSLDLSAFRPDRSKADALRLLEILKNVSGRAGTQPPVRLSGAIYTSVLNPADGRKNWGDMIVAFVEAFRDTPTATLIIKLSHSSLENGIYQVLRRLSLLGEFQCEVILIDGLLATDAYNALIDITTYAVNTSSGEGQCLPLMEYMSCGRPSIAPGHSAMLDYATPENCFIVRTEKRIGSWPHDERSAYRCHHEHVIFDDLVRQYRESYRVARDEPQRYERMSAAAAEGMRKFCSDEVVLGRFTEALDYLRRVNGQKSG